MLARLAQVDGASEWSFGRSVNPKRPLNSQISPSVLQKKCPMFVSQVYKQARFKPQQPQELVFFFFFLWVLKTNQQEDQVLIPKKTLAVLAKACLCFSKVLSFSISKYEQIKNCLFFTPKTSTPSELPSLSEPGFGSCSMSQSL